MPALTIPTPGNGITKFTNCRIIKDGALVEEDLWVSSTTGSIVAAQQAFFDDKLLPGRTINLNGRIISPGLIDVQLNGAFGLNFSDAVPDMTRYGKCLNDLNSRLAQTGVTSYLPTVTSQTSELYRTVLPYLGPSGFARSSSAGAESLGAHCEGPFLNPGKHGIHNKEVLRSASTMADLEDMYGAENINPEKAAAQGKHVSVRMITAAPEVGNMTALILELQRHGIIFSMGHSEATYEQASAAIAAGTRMITHLFNAMMLPHHRNPGIFGQLGKKKVDSPRPYFGVIADGHHLHPSMAHIAYSSDPERFILVTDAMHMAGLPDGRYSWTNGEGEHWIIKKGVELKLEGTESIAGSSITLLECVNNFLKWTGVSIPDALRAVTSTPAEMLGLQGSKGSLNAGADADLVIFSEETDDEGDTQLVIDEVWKFGNRVFQKGEPYSPVYSPLDSSPVDDTTPLSSSSELEYVI